MFPRKLDNELRDQLGSKVANSGSNDWIDAKCFWETWNQHQPFLLNLCRRWMKGNETEAQEILSGGMLQAFERSQGNLDHIGNPRAWLAQVIRNCCIDNFRHQQRSPHFSVDPEFLLELPGKDEQEQSPEQGLMKQESYQQLKSAVENLPDKLRSVLILRAYQDMPYKEIGLQLHISPANARKRIQKARLLVRESFSGDAQEPNRQDRQADPQANDPRSERSAAEDTLALANQRNPVLRKYSHAVWVRLPNGSWREKAVYHQQKPLRIKQRIMALQKYIANHSKGWKRQLEYARLLELQGDWSEAISHGLQVLQKQRHLPEFRLCVAEWLVVMDREKEAIALLKDGRAKLPYLDWQLHLTGKIFQLQGQLQGAIQHFHLAIQKQESEYKHRIALGKLYLDMEKPLESMDILAGSWDREARQVYHCALENGKFSELQAANLREMKCRFQADPLLLAAGIRLRIAQGLFHGKEGKETKRQLTQMRKIAPFQLDFFYAQLAFHWGRKEWKKGELWLRSWQKLPETKHVLSKSFSKWRLLEEEAQQKNPSNFISPAFLCHPLF